jgi:hypothetical protein
MIHIVTSGDEHTKTSYTNGQRLSRLLPRIRTPIACHHLQGRHIISLNLFTKLEQYSCCVIGVTMEGDTLMRYRIYHDLHFCRIIVLQMRP